MDSRWSGDLTLKGVEWRGGRGEGEEQYCKTFGDSDGGCYLGQSPGVLRWSWN